MNEPEYIDPRQLRPGPIRHESLPPVLLEQIKAVFDVIGSYLGMNLEQFEIGFMRDMHPENEVALWCSITAAWLAYHEKFLSDDDACRTKRRRKMLGASDCDLHWRRRRGEAQRAGRDWAQADSMLQRYLMSCRRKALDG